jgi:MATE family multidrug resistance protein
VIPTYLTWKLYKPDLFASWIWCSLYVITLGFIFMGRFVGGKWKTMSIIEEEPVVIENQPNQDVASTVA